MKRKKKTVRPTTPTSAVTKAPDNGSVGEQRFRRPETAEFLGVSESTVCRLERSGELPPSFDEKGFHVHSLQQLREYKLREGAKSLPSSPEFDGNVAAAAFELFDRGLGPADAVQHVVIGPRVARDLHRDWANLRNSFVLEGEARDRIERLADYCNGEQINNSDDLVRALEQIGSHCRCCNGWAAWFCPRCCLRQANTVEQISQKADDAIEARRAADALRRTEAKAVQRAATAVGQAGTARPAQRDERTDAGERPAKEDPSL